MLSRTRIDARDYEHLNQYDNIELELQQKIDAYSEESQISELESPGYSSQKNNKTNNNYNDNLMNVDNDNNLLQIDSIQSEQRNYYNDNNECDETLLLMGNHETKNELNSNDTDELHSKCLEPYMIEAKHNKSFSFYIDRLYHKIHCICILFIILEVLLLHYISNNNQMEMDEKLYVMITFIGVLCILLLLLLFSMIPNKLYQRHCNYFNQPSITTFAFSIGLVLLYLIILWWCCIIIKLNNI